MPEAAGAVRRRADAERNIAAILEAAIEAAAEDPTFSMAGIARRAGVARATLYVHFPTRDQLVEAITERAIREATDLVAAAEPAKGKPAAALERVVRAGWLALARFNAVSALNADKPASVRHRQHRPVLALVQPVIERGRRDGVFRTDVGTHWHLAMILAVLHAAGTEVHAGRAPADAEDAVVRTVLGALRA